MFYLHVVLEHTKEGLSTADSAESRRKASPGNIQHFLSQAAEYLSKGL